MAGTLLQLGPFKGGLNNASDPTNINDAELAVAQNWDYDVDGTLISRPAIVTDSSTGPAASQNTDFLGYFTDSATGTTYLIASTATQIWFRSSGAWTSITTGFKASAATQYLDKMWIVAEPGSASNGGSWSPSGGFATVATMPKGTAITTFKDRLWIAAGKLEQTNGSRLYFSAIADGTTWNGADFIDVNKGDGQKLVDLYSLSTNLYLFKDNSTYVLQYDSSPSKGVVNAVSKTIGVADIRCVVQYENILYLFHGGYLYELINYSFNKVNIRTNITANASGTYFRNIHVSQVGNRIIVFYYGNTYVFYLFTRTWSKWTAIVPVSKLWAVPGSASGAIPQAYSVASNTSSDRTTYTLNDGYSSVWTESGVHSRFETKIYDFHAPNLFKKLYWWGIDALTVGQVDTQVVPVLYNFAETWTQMSAFTWGQLLTNTWARPSETDISVRESLMTVGSVRKFLKLLKTVRFRNVYFVMDATISDWANPTRVYSVTASVNMKEQVAKTIN